MTYITFVKFKHNQKVILLDLNIEVRVVAIKITEVIRYTIWYFHEGIPIEFDVCDDEIEEIEDDRLKQELTSHGY